METISTFFIRPRFRDRVSAFACDGGAEIDYRDQGCVVSLHADLKPDLDALMACLRKGGKTFSELQIEIPNLAGSLREILDEFDRLGLLTESANKLQGNALSGSQFHRELIRFVDRQKATTSDSLFFRLLVERNVTRRQLIGYAIEYYHVVSLCPQLLAPSLANIESPRTNDILRQFFVAELYHDRLLARALSAVGIGESQRRTMIPLPSTFAVCSALGVAAKQHPLSFKAALFVFETPYPEFIEAFGNHCKQLELPSAFIDPFVEHSDINDEESHEKISEELFSEVAMVSSEEQLVVKKNIAHLIESLAKMEHQILTYYGNEDALVPRCFA
jgi:pyrroloquinoline quinone (PQQ) biosynthesis protein C